MQSKPQQRMTRQREAILEEVKSTCDHPSADEVYERVKKRIPRISLGSVYRNLDVLVSMGFIQRLESGAQMRFDWNTKEHCHLSCVRCGRIEDAPMVPSNDFMDVLDKAAGKLTKEGIFGYHLDFFGLCSSCLEQGYRYPDKDVEPGKPGS